MEQLSLDTETGGLGNDVSRWSIGFVYADKNLDEISSYEIYRKADDDIYKVEANALEIIQRTPPMIATTVTRLITLKIRSSRQKGKRPCPENPRSCCIRERPFIGYQDIGDWVIDIG